MIMKAGKFQALQLASWRLRRADGVVLVQRAAGSRLGKSEHSSSSAKAGKNQYPSSKAVRQARGISLFQGGSIFLF